MESQVVNIPLFEFLLLYPMLSNKFSRQFYRIFGSLKKDWDKLIFINFFKVWWLKHRQVLDWLIINQNATKLYNRLDSQLFLLELTYLGKSFIILLFVDAMNNKQWFIFSKFPCKNQAIVIHTIMRLEELKHCIFIKILYLVIYEVEKFLFRISNSKGEVWIFFQKCLLLVVFKPIKF